jgi:AcrR family transcriptional regulator
MAATVRSSDGRRSQADRRARTRSALLEAAARGLSRYGYANLMLERVAGEAGYTRGALYHLFANKEDLALAVVRWIEETWNAEVGQPAAAEADPVDALITLARGHAIYCRRDIARVMLTLRVEFAGQDHPVGQAIAEIIDRLTADCTKWISAGRQSGTIPAGPPPRKMAGAYLGVVEAVAISLAGQAHDDTELAERAARGVLGLPPRPFSTDPQGDEDMERHK